MITAQEHSTLPTYSRKYHSDHGDEWLHDQEHFVCLVRKTNPPALIHRLLETTSHTEWPDVAALVEGVSGILPPPSRNQLFQAVARCPEPVMDDLEKIAERIDLLNDEYGRQAIHSLLDKTNHNDAAILACEPYSRVLALYLQDAAQGSTRRLEQVEHLQVIHRQWKSELYSSHYRGPKGIDPQFTPAIEESLRKRIIELYPLAAPEDVLIEHFTYRDYSTCDAAPVHTITVRFNGRETCYDKIEQGEIVYHEDLAAMAVRYTWCAVRGTLSVFSEDRTQRQALASLFRDVVLADGQIEPMPIWQFDLEGFSKPAMMERLANERMDDIERISILHLKLAHPATNRADLMAAEETELVQHYTSRLTIARDRRDCRNLYTIAQDDYHFANMDGCLPEQVKLVFEIAKQSRRKAHKVAVQLTTPNGLNDESKTKEDRALIMAQLAALGIVEEF